MIANSESFENFLMHLAIAFVNMPPDSIDEEFDKALAMTGKFTSVDRSYVMSYDFDAGLVKNTHEWCAEGVSPMIDELQAVPIEGIEATWVDLHRKGEIVHISDVQSLEAESPLRLILEPQGILTLVAVPMLYQGTCLGFVGFDAVKQPINWSNEQLTLVRMLAELFTNAEMCRRRVQAIRREQSKAESAGRLLEKAVEATRIAVWQIELDRPVAYMVTGWNSLLDVDWDGRHIDIDEFRAWVHADDLEGIDRAMARSIRNPRNSETVEYRVRTRKSRWRTFRSWWVCEVDAVTKKHRLYGGTMDVSETTRRAESHQVLSQISSRFVDLESYHEAMDSAMESICVFCGADAAKLFLLDDLSEQLDRVQMADSSGCDACLTDLWHGKCMVDSDDSRKLISGSVITVACCAERGAPDISSAISSPSNRLDAVFVPLLVGGRFEGAIALLHDSSSGLSHGATDDFLRGCSDIIAGAIARFCAEKSLRESVKLHQRVLNNLDDVIFLTDFEGRITFINDSGRGFCGIPTASVLGHRITQWIEPIHPYDAEILNSREPDIGPARKIIMRVRDGESRERHISYSRHALKNEKGVITGYLSTIADVTAQRNWEESLIAGKIKAESTNDAKTLYLSNLSHEIRTPMHGVLGMLELIMRGGRLADKDVNHAQAAYESCRNLLRLFDDVLDIAKLERGVMQLDPTDIDVKKVMERSVLMFQKEVTSKALIFEIDLSSRLPNRILLDELRFSQIVCNLVSNAIRYTKSGRVAVSLNAGYFTMARAASPVNCLRLLVEDTGIGIASDDIDSLFQPFVQLKKPGEKSALEGSGLGLWITKELTDLMGGSIEIRSRIGEGTTVDVKIPLIIPKRIASSYPTCDAQTDQGQNLKGISILIAEDNETSRILACEHLAGLGCDFVAVEDGLKAVTESQKRKFHFIIMDCAMPVLDGFDASRRILANHDDGIPPVIIGCTANPSDAAVAKCLAAGMRSVLVKPYTRKELAQALQSDIYAMTAASQAAVNNHTQKAKPEVPPIINLATISALENQLTHAKITFEMIVDVFCKTSTEQIREISDSSAVGDWQTCGRIAHSLKGGCLSIGAVRLSALCAEMEDACHADSVRATEPRVSSQDLENLVSEHAAAIEALRQRVRPRG